DLFLRLLSGNTRLVNVRSKTLTADKQTFFTHQLHLLQRRRIAAVFAELFMDFTHRRRSQPPENGEDVDFSCGRKRKSLSFAIRGVHNICEAHYNDIKRSATIKIVD